MVVLICIKMNSIKIYSLIILKSNLILIIINFYTNTFFVLDLKNTNKFSKNKGK
jgi:hypothetical protein